MTAPAVTRLDLGALAAAILAFPAPSATRVVSIDGYSGAGKSWLADRIAPLLDAVVLPIDVYVPGWDALPAGAAALDEAVLTPLRAGLAARHRSYDWTAGAPGAWHTWEPGGTLLVEGSGAGAVADSHIDVLLWVDTAAPLRAQQLDHRADHALYAPFRAPWAAQERRVATAHRTPERADLLLTRMDEDSVEVTVRPRDPDQEGRCHGVGRRQPIIPS